MQLLYFLLFICISTLAVTGHRKHKEKELLRIKRQHGSNIKSHHSLHKEREDKPGHNGPASKTTRGDNEKALKYTAASEHSAPIDLLQVVRKDKENHHHHTIKKVLSEKKKRDAIHKTVMQTDKLLHKQEHPKTDNRHKIYKTVNKSGSKIKQIMKNGKHKSNHKMSKLTKGHQRKNDKKRIQLLKHHKAMKNRISKRTSQDQARLARAGGIVL